MDVSDFYVLIVFNVIGTETIWCPFDATKLQFLVSTKKHHFRPICESYRFFWYTLYIRGSAVYDVPFNRFLCNTKKAGNWSPLLHTSEINENIGVSLWTTNTRVEITAIKLNILYTSSFFLFHFIKNSIFKIEHLIIQLLLLNKNSILAI